MENFKQRLEILEVDNGFIVSTDTRYNSYERDYEEMVYFMQNTADYILDKNATNEQIASSIRTKLNELRQQKNRNKTFICNNKEEVKQAIDLLLKV